MICPFYGGALKPVGDEWIHVSCVIWLPPTLAALSAAATQQVPPDEEGEGDAVASLAAAGSSGVLWLLAGWGLVTLFPVRTSQARTRPSPGERADKWDVCAVCAGNQDAGDHDPYGAGAPGERAVGIAGKPSLQRAPKI